MSGKIGIVALPEGWFNEVIKCFEPSEIAVFVTTRKMEAELRARVGENLEIHILDLARVCEATPHLNDCDVIVGDQWQLKRLVPVHIDNPAETKVAAFAHASDAPPVILTTGRNFLICSAEKLIDGIRNQFRHEVETGKYTADKIETILPHLSDADSIDYEAGYSGLYHLDPACFSARRDRARNRQTLLEALGLNGDDRRKIVTCYVDEISDFRAMDRGLSALADDYIIAVKTFRGYTEQHPLDKVIVVDDRRYNDLLRIGSDFILAGIVSGSLSTCIMLGLRAVPYFSQVVHRNAVTREKYYLGETDRPEPYPISIDRLAQRTNAYAKDIVPAVDIGDPAALRQVFEDAAFWRDFETRIDDWAHGRAFGDYLTTDAASKTAALLRQIAKDGTLGDDAMLKGSFDLTS